MATIDEIKTWLEKNPLATDAQIATAAQNAGVTAAQLSAATGVPVAQVESRLAAATTSSPTTASTTPTTTTTSTVSPSTTATTTKAATPPTWNDTYNKWFINEYLPFINSRQGTNYTAADLQVGANGAIIPNPGVPLWNWNTGADTAAQKAALDQKYLESLAAYNKANNTNVQPDISALGANAQPNTTYRAADKSNGLFGTGIGPDVSWTSIRDPLEAAGVVAGNYFLPGSSLVTGQLVSEGAKEQLATPVGMLANIAAGGIGGAQGNMANYGNLTDAVGITNPAQVTNAQFASYDVAGIREAVGNDFAAIEQNLVASGMDPLIAADISQTIAFNPNITNEQLATTIANNFGSNIYDVNMDTTYPTSVLPGEGGLLSNVPTATTTPTTTPTTTTTQTPSTSTLTPSQTINLAKTGLTVAGLLATPSIAKGLTNVLTPSTGALSLTPQNRAGISSGSAQYSPEYYQAIQSKYNQMMPQQPRDVTTELKNWYETKYAPTATITPKVA